MTVKYNWEELPDFTVDSFDAASTHQRGDYGWDSTTLSKERHARAMSRANGILCGTNKRMRARFFVNDVSLDIGLSGTFGQSRRRRTFYPHNITLPSYTVQGQCLDQNDYANLTEFIHQSHQDAISNGSNLLQLNVLGGGLLAADGKKPTTMKGPHNPIVAYGFVEGIERKHERWKYAPAFQFQFVVVEQAVGIYAGITYRDEHQRSFLEIIKEQEKPFSQAPSNTKNSQRGASGKQKK